MNKTNDIEKNITALEEELRAMGEPYSGSVPGDEYFNDFQARLMQRIDAEHPAVVKKASVSMPMRITAILGVCVLIVAGYFFLNRPNTSESAASAIDNETLYDINVAQTKPEVKQNVASSQNTNPTKVTEPAKPAVPPTPAPKAIAAKPATKMTAENELDKIDELSVGEPDAPVTYDKLSNEELESVLRVLESQEFESERNEK